MVTYSRTVLCGVDEILRKEGRKCFYLTTHSTHFIQVSRSETRCRHIGYSFRLAARVLLYAHRQENTIHGLCYTSRGGLAGTRKSSMGSSRRIDPTTHRTMSERSFHEATSRSPKNKRQQSIILSAVSEFHYYY